MTTPSHHHSGRPGRPALRHLRTTASLALLAGFIVPVILIQGTIDHRILTALLMIAAVALIVPSAFTQIGQWQAEAQQRGHTNGINHAANVLSRFRSDRQAHEAD